MVASRQGTIPQRVNISLVDQSHKQQDLITESVLNRSRLIGLLALILLSLPATAMAKDAGSFGLGIGGAFNLTNTKNDVTSGESVDNNTLFLRLNPRAEYFFTDGVPVVFRAGLLTRSLDRGPTNATETDGIFTVGSGYHLKLNEKIELLFEAELGAYFGSSESSVEINNVTVDVSTDTRGAAFGAGLGFSLMVSDNSQLRAGVSYTGLVGNESVQNSDETLSATTHAVGLTLGYMYFF